MDIASIVTSPTTVKKVPRPLNCFMTYRLEKQREILLQCPGTNHREISKITAKWWKEMSAAEKEPYRFRALKAKLDHEKKYPNYKFNPKKKVTKTRTYRKRTEDVFTPQEFAQKQRLSVLYHNGIKTDAPSNPVLEYLPTIIESKEDICCATCYSSSVPSNNCFSKENPENFHSVSSQPVSPPSSSPYPVFGYHQDANSLNYNQLYPPNHYYGFTGQPTYPYDSPFSMESIQQSYNSHDNQAPTSDYYPDTKNITDNAGSHDLNSLIQATYNDLSTSTILSPFYYHQ